LPHTCLLKIRKSLFHEKLKCTQESSTERLTLGLLTSKLPTNLLMPSKTRSKALTKEYVYRIALTGFVKLQDFIFEQIKALGGLI
jgi:hypothetical protein